MDLRFPLRSVNYLEQNYNIWVIQYLYDREGVHIKPLRSRLEAIQKL